jgi:hypothetical protein
MNTQIDSVPVAGNAWAERKESGMSTSRYGKDEKYIYALV